MADNQDSIVALRCAQQHQVQLTVQADQKANINIGIVSLVVIFLSNSKLPQAAQSDLIIKMGMFLFILMVGISLTMALIVVLPRLGRARTGGAKGMANPFYFGSFSRLSQDEYVE